jgi:glucose/arabinose dehydrogenase
MRRTIAGLFLALLAFAACEDDPQAPPSNGNGNGPPPLPDSVLVFLDITARVAATPGFGELGLLGLAFHPKYETNGQFFVYYTAGGSGSRVSRVSRFRVSALDPNAADPGSESVILEFSQPFDNHNAGQIAFGADDYLYIATGDGGSGGDPQDNAQDRTNLLGKILRIDVDSGTPYAIPLDNPFEGNTDGYREEIYAYGLRNPWRFSFDPPTGRLWVGDVGQLTWEEIDVVESGMNYGWDCREGAHDYSGPPGGPSADCATATGLVDPVWEYGRASGNSVTGGYVYRGDSLTSVEGKYVFADYGSGRIWALSYDGVNPSANELLFDAPFLISTFGIDKDSELYLIQYAASGRLHRIEQTEVGPGTYTYALAHVFADYVPDYGVDLQHAGDGTARLFAVEQAGRIVVFDSTNP